MTNLGRMKASWWEWIWVWWCWRGRGVWKTPVHFNSWGRCSRRLCWSSSSSTRGQFQWSPLPREWQIGFDKASGKAFPQTMITKPEGFHCWQYVLSVAVKFQPDPPHHVWVFRPLLPSQQKSSFSSWAPHPHHFYDDTFALSRAFPETGVSIVSTPSSDGKQFSLTLPG